MRLNSTYKARYNLYDVNDANFYVFKIISDMKYNENEQVPYYEAILLIHDGQRCDYKVSFYPYDWSIIEKLTSLEEELL